MKNEKISVIMAVYNCKKTVIEAIESIQKQTYQNWELIICDDCSTDGTYDVVSKYISNNNPEKFVLLKNEKNMKLPFSLNRCLEHATGKFVARMDGDDISYSDRFQKQIDFLYSHPDIDLVGVAMDVYDGERIIGQNIRPANVNGFTLFKSPVFNHATILTYRYVYEKLGGYSLLERAIRCEDLDLWFRFFDAGFKGANLQEALYRVTDDINAKGRRDFTNRIHSSKTLFFGYRLLHYPWYCYPNALNPIVKGFVPKPIYDYLRNRKFRNY